MKKIILSLICLIVFLSTSIPANADVIYGLIYKNSTEPLLGSGSASRSRMGEATCTSFLGLVGFGDCSVATAMQKGRIRSLSHADMQIRNILGYRVVKVRAYGN